jgi:hypothetical protein
MPGAFEKGRAVGVSERQPKILALYILYSKFSIAED